MSDEIWKVIPGWEAYEASSIGRIRRIEATRRCPPKYILRSSIDQNGYVKICVQQDGRIYYTQIHVLVAAAFIGERPKGLEVDHIDRNRTNNIPQNLRYVTRQENCRNKVFNSPSGENHHNAVLTEKIVVEIRRRAANRERIKSIARDLRIPYLTVYDAAKRITWRHVI